jgi:lipopolysaccharide transport system permease protein
MNRESDPNPNPSSTGCASAASRAVELPVLIIKPTKGLVSLRLAELWQYRELLYFLVWRDIKVRYKQTMLGTAWAVLQPFLTMVVFSVFFGRLAGMKSLTGGIAYPVFTFCALLPWQLFARALTYSGNSLVANQQLITKVYFPRLLIPVSAVGAGLVDFAIAFVVLAGMMFYYHVVPTVAVAALPLFLLFAVATCLASGLWLSALNVEFRDVRYTIPFLTQFWLVLTPIAYPSSVVPPQYRAWYGLNPMAGVVDGFRWTLLGTPPPSMPLLCISVATVIALLMGGLIYFRRMERTFADVV